MGTPLAARFELADGTQWAGLFEAGGLGGIDGIFACPGPDQAVAVCDGQAYLIAVTAPAGRRESILHPSGESAVLATA